VVLPRYNRKGGAKKNKENKEKGMWDCFAEKEEKISFYVALDEATDEASPQ
jgi:hypothetical protein